MRRIIATALVGSLIGGIALTPAIASKKKPRPKAKPKPIAVDVSYYLRRDACGTEEDALELSIVDGPDSGTGCGSAYSGLGNEAFKGTGNAPSSYFWPASDGVPLTLNTAKDITGEITVRSFEIGSPVPAPPYAAAGEATLVVTLLGVTEGEPVVVGTTSDTYMVTPADRSHTSEFTISPEGSMEKAVFTELQLETYVRGSSALHGFFELDDPASFVTIPTWVKRKERPSGRSI